MISYKKNMKPRMIIVDEHDNVIGHKYREDEKPDDIYRVSALWITNSKGDILLAKRHRNKKHDPGKWGPAVAGTVDEGETYEQNIIKEAEEELGLKNIKPTLGPKTAPYGQYKYFTQWFTLKIDKPASELIFQEDEVEEIKWFTKKELLESLQKHPEKFLPKMPRYIGLFLS
ncbi:NUDIX domain-containing protein [Candidatus Woesearchaeota archaeon]|nr:MAG: NUDIX domain-containing protein [Candidatus Woesearchaeota archaeon]